MVCISPNPRRVGYIVPIHGPLDGPLYMGSIYSNTKNYCQVNVRPTLFCDAWISMRFARWANFSVLWVSSELLDAGVTVQISCKRKKKNYEKS